MKLHGAISLKTYCVVPLGQPCQGAAKVPQYCGFLVRKCEGAVWLMFVLPRRFRCSFSWKAADFHWWTKGISGL